jgi:hypothetical protein
LTGFLIVALHAVGGCAMFSGQSDAPAPAKTQPSAQTQAAAATQPQADGGNSVTDSVQSTARRLAEAMSRSSAKPADQSQANQPPATQPSRVQWRDAAERSRPKPPRAQQFNEQTAKADTTNNPPATQPAHKPLAKQPREALVDELTRRIATGSDRPMRQAIAAVGLGLANNQPEPASALTRGLTATQQKQIERFYSLNKTLAANLLDGSGTLHRRQVDKQVQKLFPPQPLTIKKVDLCKSVEGFGVYTPFEDHQFLSERSQKMIVYVELDHFNPKKLEDRFEVKLKQEVVLFNEADGLAVWSHEPVTIVDRSRNERQDFFTVQLITLPKRLSVGKFRLKVRVTDVHGDSVDETTLPLQRVADPAIAQGNKQPK